MAKETQLTLDQLPPTVSTTDGSSTVSILTVPAFAANNGGQEITFDVVGHDFDNAETASAKIAVKLKNVSGTPTMIGTPVHIVPISAGSSSGLVTASVNVIVSGTNLHVNVIGVSGRTIYWSATRWPSVQVLDGYTATNPLSLTGIAVGGDLSGTLPNPTVVSVLDGYTPVTTVTALGGDVTGTTPASTVVKLQGRAVESGAPSDGDALIWNAGSSEWQASNTLTVGGDLTGTTSSANVVKIYGRDIASDLPTDGYVLTWQSSNSKWTPRTTGASIGLAGDVTGTAGANTVSKIQNRTVASTAPTDGYSLIWNPGTNEWQPSGITKIHGNGVSSVLRWVNIGNGELAVGGIFNFNPEADYSLNANAVTTGGGTSVQISGARGKSNGASALLRAGGLAILSGGDGYNDGAGGNVNLISGTSDNGAAGDIQFFLGDGTGSTKGYLVIHNSNTDTSASAGAATALPGPPLGYLVLKLGATTIKIPYYAN